MNRTRVSARARATVIRISRRLPHCLFQSHTQYLLCERIVALIKHIMWSESNEHRTKNTTKLIPFLFVCLLLGLVVLVVFVVFCCCWRNYYNLFYAEKSLCPYTSNMSLHYLSTFSQFLLADCHSTGDDYRTQRGRCASATMWRRKKKRCPLNCYYFFLWRKWWWLLAAKYINFARSWARCLPCCVAVVVELNWYTCIEMIACSLVYLLRTSWYTNCV